MSQKISRRYAKAFYDVAAEQKEEERLLQELQFFATMYDEEVSFREFILNPVFQSEERKQVFDKILEKTKASLTGKTVLKFLLWRKRMRLLPQITEEYFTVLNQKKNRAVAEIWSAFELENKEQKEIQEQLQTMIGKEILLKSQKDPSLIGGLKVKIGSVIIESNIKYHLEKMRQELLGYY